ncbi:MAG TPA: YfhO family protein [Cytophagaceae bacterium]|nr:YfhO family protein [Cytophagaceae bacterium]
MTNSILKKLAPHLAAHLAFILILCIYYAPVFSGKKLVQNDIVQSAGFLKESLDYAKQSKEEILWTNSMFSGMPSWRGYSTNIIKYYHSITTTVFSIPILLGYLAFLGFYLLLLTLGANHWLSFIGSAAFAFSSFNIISIEAGHTNKVFDMALMAPVIAGIILVYDRKYWLGAAITTLFLSIHIFYAHYQITYYLIITIVFLGVYELIKNIRQKTLPHFAIASLILVLSAIIAVGPNISQIWTTQVYSKSTQRGGSELTLNKDKSAKGLDKDYTFAWSNGKMESMTGFIPYFYGGSSSEELGQGSDTYKELVDHNVPKNEARSYVKNIPLYWGDQPFTSGPVYFGATIIFLFFLALFLLKDSMKWWVLAVTILSILLSWGKNFEIFNDIFYYNFPLYNKFRSVTMTMAITQVTLPFLAIAVLVKLSKNEITYPDFMKGLKWATIICGGIALFFGLLGGAFFDFTTEGDENLAKQIPDWMMDAIRSDRANKLRSDSFRSLFFVLVTAGLLWAFVKEKIKPVAFYVVLAALVVLDLTIVDKRYLGYDTFKSAKSFDREAFAMSSADEMILMDKDPYYRVANFSKSIFNDATTSYFHKSVGGYSAIKLGRYQDLIENQLGKNNIAVYSMLNTKYFIVPDQKTQQPMVQRNPDAMGNAWFVSDIKLVNNADEEMQAMDSTNFRSTAILNKEFNGTLQGLQFAKDSTGYIRLTNYHPNRLSYESKAATEQLAVFSDIYYQPGWNAYINGKLTPHVRVDYVLRGLRIPAGEHKIEFKFEPQHYFTGEKISLAGSILFVAFILAAAVLAYLQQRKQNANNTL